MIDRHLVAKGRGFTVKLFRALKNPSLSPDTFY